MFFQCNDFFSIKQYFCHWEPLEWREQGILGPKSGIRFLAVPVPELKSGNRFLAVLVPGPESENRFLEVLVPELKNGNRLFAAWVLEPQKGNWFLAVPFVFYKET